MYMYIKEMNYIKKYCIICIAGDESGEGKHYLKFYFITLKFNHLRDFGSLTLIKITPKECSLSQRYSFWNVIEYVAISP